MSATHEPKAATVKPEKRIGIRSVIADGFDERDISREQLKEIYKDARFDTRTSSEIVFLALEHSTKPIGTPRPRMEDPAADALLLDLIRTNESEVR